MFFFYFGHVFTFLTFLKFLFERLLRLWRVCCCLPYGQQIAARRSGCLAAAAPQHGAQQQMRAVSRGRRKLKTDLFRLVKSQENASYNITGLVLYWETRSLR